MESSQVDRSSSKDVRVLTGSSTRRAESERDFGRLVGAAASASAPGPVRK